MSVKEEIRSQIEGALKGASFPIETPEALLAAFPNGAETTCKSGDLVIKAGDAGKVLTAEYFSRSRCRNHCHTRRSLITAILTR